MDLESFRLSVWLVNCRKFGAKTSDVAGDNLVGGRVLDDARQEPEEVVEDEAVRLRPP